MKHRILAIALLVAAPGLLAAQTDPITIRLGPAPNQTLHGRTVQDMTMSIAPDPAAAAMLPIPATSIQISMTIDTTATVGPADGAGHYESRMVCDNVSGTTTVNGKPAPFAMPTAAITGQAFTFFYDDAGRVIDVKAEGTLSDMMAAPIKQALSSAMASAPPITLTVGETVAVPTQMNLPVPAASGGSGMTVTGETRYTLVSITFDGADRIAHLKTAMTSTVNRDTRAGAGAPTMGADMRITSEGTSDVNVDRGIALHTEQRMTIDGTMRMAAPAGVTSTSMPEVPTMLMHGTATIKNDLAK